MSIIKKPDLTDPNLRAKLAKGMGHQYYGEPAWPNDLLYMFPVVILGTIGCIVGLSVLEPSAIGEKADPFATPLEMLGTLACVVGLAVLAPTQLGEPADPFNTPLEILPEWYFFPTFNLLRVIPNKLIGVLSMAAVPAGLILIPFIENINKFQNPFRRPIATTIFLLGTIASIWLGIGATMPLSKAINLGLF